MSVGEVASAIPLLRALHADHPFVCIYLSTSTVAGRKAAVQQASGLVNGVFYCPLDYVSCVRRVMRAIRPALVVILETEIWPNLFAESKRFGASLAIVNGRISNRAWPRYWAFRELFGPILMLPDLTLVQSAVDRERYADLGSPLATLEIAPNLKYDASFDREPVPLDTYGAQQVWIAASTVGPNERGSLTRHAVDEDDIIIRTFQNLIDDFPELLLIIAPRQPARFDEVASKLEASGYPFLRRTAVKTDPSLRLQLPGILLLDTLGELSGAYPLADLTFVGGSLAPRGGHNILEPAASARPIVVGPHMENFEAIAKDFREAGALIQIGEEQELLPVVHWLLSDRERARQLGVRAFRVVQAGRGSARSVSDRLWLLHGDGFPRNVPNPIARCLLFPLAAIWKHGGAWRRKRSERACASLPPLGVPVVSIGGITMGGAGKTPFTAYLAKRLKQGGSSPAILTRGYRRHSSARSLVFGPGVKVSSALTGDEAQTFLRSGSAPVGIGASRYLTAGVLREAFPATDVLLLDDGFQHARITHDFDVVLIDGLDPFGGGDVVPLGRLREPLTALGRADAFVVTRAEDDIRLGAISRQLRRFNDHAPVFRTRLTARGWHYSRSGRSVPNLGARRVGAFCGLGNPDNFWQTLKRLGLEIVFRWPFPDHHAYTPVELQRLAYQATQQGAEILVTTEKDFVNCPPGLAKLIAPLDLAWLEIEFELENEAGFLSTLTSALAVH